MLEFVDVSYSAGGKDILKNISKFILSYNYKSMTAHAAPTFIPQDFPSSVFVA